MITNKRLASGTLSNANATLYTAPAAAGSYTIIKSLTLCNNSASAATITLKFDGIELYSAYSMAANTSLIITSIDQIIEASELIEGSSGTDAVIKYIISGKEITA